MENIARDIGYTVHDISLLDISFRNKEVSEDKPKKTRSFFIKICFISFGNEELEGWRFLFWTALTLQNSFYHNPVVAAVLKTTEQQVLDNKISSFVAAKRLIDLFLKS